MTAPPVVVPLRWDMAPRSLVTYTHPALNTPAEPLDVVTVIVYNLASRLWATVARTDAKMIAATQVGESVRMIVGRDGNTLLDPHLERGDETTYTDEACITRPGRRSAHERATSGTLTGMLLTGEWHQWKLTGFLVGEWEHAIGHLDGKMHD